MPTTPRGIWTPNDSDDWDLVTDLAAFAVSVDTAIGTAITALPLPTGYIGTNNQRLALTAPDLRNGITFFASDTNVPWRRIAGAWVSQDTGWVAATLLNSWVNAAAGEEVEYSRVGGVTYLGGRAALGTSATGFNLPLGFRPNKLKRFIVPSGASATACLVTISTGGDVTLVSGTQPNFAAISFPAVV